MAGKLIILFKDKDVPAEVFAHLSDVVVFNQYVPVPGKPGEHIEWEANQEELDRIAWTAQFSGKDFLYILDRPEDIRIRLQQSRGAIGGAFKVADIVLVQIGNEIHCVKNSNGMRPVLKFACENVVPGKTEDQIVVDTLRDAIDQRKSMLQSCGYICSDCGFSEAESALDLYQVFDSGAIARVKMIEFGALRDFNDVLRDVEHAQVLCLNCLSKRNEQYRQKRSGRLQ